MSALVLLSGWGCDARIWQPLAPHWPTGLEVTTPDWPGYGERAMLADAADLRALADAMADELPAEAVWVGWSLGGLLIAALLDYLPAPRALVQVGMGPRFCLDGGVSSGELEAFRRAFTRAPDATHQHFLRWQLQGELTPRAAHRRLLELLGEASRGEASPGEPPCADNATLAAGLAQLAGIDLTECLKSPPCPVWRVAGERDPLLAPSLRESADYRLADAGHCPMLTQPQALANCLTGIVETARRPGAAIANRAASS